MEFSARFPFDGNLSENKRLAWNPKAHRMFAARGYKVAQGRLDLVLSFARAKAKAVFDPKRKVSVDLVVFKPNGRSDSQNFLKGCLDSVARAIKVNDSMFEGSWRWEIDKDDPRIKIFVSQEDLEIGKI